MTVWNLLRRSLIQKSPSPDGRNAEQQPAPIAPRHDTLADGGQPLVPMSEAEIWADWDPEYLSLQNDPS